MTTTRNVGHLETMTSALDRIYVYTHIILCVDCSRLKGKCPTEKLRELPRVAVIIYDNNNNIML